jgi:hypothetical protein
MTVGSSLREDPAPRLLGEILHHRCVLEDDFSPGRYRRTGSVGAAPCERDVPKDEEAGAVLPQQPALEAGLPELVPFAVERQRPGRLPDRLAAPTGPEGDVLLKLDRLRHGVLPRLLQLGLRANEPGRRSGARGRCGRGD